MEIKTKFNIGDKVMLTYDDCRIAGEIIKMEIDYDGELLYFVNFGKKLGWNNDFYKEEDLKRVGKPILDNLEKLYLLDVIKPFKSQIRAITKYRCLCENNNMEHILIHYKDGKIITSFPSFKKDKMYKGMEIGKNYTLAELELD